MEIPWLLGKLGKYLLQFFLKNEMRSLFFFFQPKKGSRYLYFEYI